MIVCPFCGYENEDGALFCEQCKSDLAGVPSTSEAPIEAEVIEAEPVEEAPMVDVIEASPVEEDIPMMADIVEAEPVEAEAAPVEEPPEIPEPPAVEVVATPVEEPEPAPVEEPAAVEEPAPAPTPVPEPEPTPAPEPVAATGGALPAGSAPRLRVIRGLKINEEFPIYEGQNYIGRADEQPVDIDLESQEPPDRIWCSRQHALIMFENGTVTLEDLNSSNGTFLNRTRVYPGQKQTLKVDDVIQIGNVQLKLMV